jgi:hypothetical protein
MGDGKHKRTRNSWNWSLIICLQIALVVQARAGKFEGMVGYTRRVYQRYDKGTSTGSVAKFTHRSF